MVLSRQHEIDKQWPKFLALGTWTCHVQLPKSSRSSLPCTSFDESFVLGILQAEDRWSEQILQGHFVAVMANMANMAKR